MRPQCQEDRGLTAGVPRRTHAGREGDDRGDVIVADGIENRLRSALAYGDGVRYA